MKQFLFAFILSLLSFGIISAAFRNELLASLVALVVLFITFFLLCLLAAAQMSEELTYTDKLTTGR